MGNRITAYLTRQTRPRRLAHAAYLEGQLARRRHEDLGALFYRGLNAWPGNLEDRCELLAGAALGWIAEDRRQEGAA
jgi:hypothetical protein